MVTLTALGLVLGFMAAQAVHVPLHNDLLVDIDQTAFIPAIEISVEDKEPRAETEEWRCDIRSWVRAPDLAPGGVYPAETRLAVNGSDCGDIVGWEVGLRLRERAIIKRRSKDVLDFPAKPAQRRIFGDREADRNDIFAVNEGWSYPGKEYQDQMEQWAAAMRNTSLWNVHSAQRVVFDLKQPLALDSIDSDKADKVRSFFVHVPNTNFPPVSYQTWSSFGQGVDGQFMNSETQFEYYHSIHLANGTVFDSPAARAAFIPQPEPVAPWTGKHGQNGETWPIKLQLMSPRVPDNETKSEDDEPWGFRSYPPTPKCDDGNLAHFTLEVTSDDRSATQGQNVTLNFTLTRSGNGTEYPTFLDVQYRTQRNLTWAYDFVASEDEYYELINDCGPRRLLARKSSIYQPSIEQMLKTRSIKELEFQREELGRTSGYFQISGDRWPIGLNAARYDMEDREELGKETYTGQFELPISERAFPSFTTTFETFQPVLTFTLHTTFMCEKADPSIEPTGELEVDSADADWVEYRLPSDEENRKRDRDGKKRFREGRGFNHEGLIPIDVRLRGDALTAPVHYLDLTALSPVLSLSESAVTEYPQVGEISIDNDVDGLKKSIYNERAMGNFMNSQRFKNPGGMWSNAGDMWQNAVMRA